MTVFQYVGSTAPALPSTIWQTVDGVTTPVNLTGGSVTFNMRSLFGDDVLVNGNAVIVGSPVDGEVQYNWTLGNVTTDIASSPGPYRGWWHVTLGSQEFDTGEFDIEFLTHATMRSTGPCTDWAGTQDVAACYADVEDDACLTSAVRMASEVLYELSGHQFSGWCQSTLRPCQDGGWCGFRTQILSRGHVVWNAGWYMDGAEACSCGFLPRITLPGVAQSIVSVTINGQVLSPSAYRLDPDNTLIRIDGGAWPACQSMIAADDADGAFTVVYTHGYEPPEIGRRAVVELAHEFWLACNSQPCSLPTGVVEVRRQGITVKRNADLWTSGATGLTAVDTFLAAYRQKPGFLVMSPDIAPTARRTA